MISITLPSMYSDALDRTLRNIDETTVNSVEVVVCSPFMPEAVLRHATLKWVKDIQRLGCNAAHAQAFCEVSNDFVVPFVDDHIFIVDWDAIALSDFMRGEKQTAKRPFILGLRQECAEQRVGTVFGRYYPYFPMMRTNDALKLGWFDPVYRRGFADVDLAFRAYTAGGHCEWSEQGLIVPHPDDNQHKDVEFGATDQDREIFLERWAGTYGKDWPATHHRDFNVDVLVPQGRRSLP